MPLESVKNRPCTLCALPAAQALDAVALNRYPYGALWLVCLARVLYHSHTRTSGHSVDARLTAGLVQRIKPRQQQLTMLSKSRCLPREESTKDKEKTKTKRFVAR